MKFHICDFKNKLLITSQKLNDLGFFHIFFSNIATKLLGFLLITLLTRILTKEALGTLSYVQSILNFVSPFVGCGLAYGLFIFLSREITYGKSLVRLGFKVATICNFLLLVFILLFTLTFPFPFSNASIAFLILFIAVVIQNYRVLFLSILRGLKRNDLIGILNGISSFITFTLASIGSFLAKLNGYLLSYLLAQILSVFFSFFVISKKIHLNSNSEFYQKKDLFLLSLNASGANFLSTLLYSIDIFLIGMLLRDAKATADYFVASIIPSNLVFFSRVILEVLQPYIASRYKEKHWIWYIYKKLSLKLLIFSGILTFVLFLINKQVILLLFSDKYLSSVEVFNILLLNFVIVGSLRIVSGNIIASLGLAKYSFFINASSVIINVVLNFLLISDYGIKGVAIATLLTNSWDSLIGALVLFSYTKDKRIGVFK